MARPRRGLPASPTSARPRRGVREDVLSRYAVNWRGARPRETYLREGEAKEKKKTSKTFEKKRESVTKEVENFLKSLFSLFLSLFGLRPCDEAAAAAEVDEEDERRAPPLRCCAF